MILTSFPQLDLILILKYYRVLFWFWPSVCVCSLFVQFKHTVCVLYKLIQYPLFRGQIVKMQVKYCISNNDCKQICSLPLKIWTSPPWFKVPTCPTGYRAEAAPPAAIEDSLPLEDTHLVQEEYQQGARTKRRAYLVINDDITVSPCPRYVCVPASTADRRDTVQHRCVSSLP